MNITGFASVQAALADGLSFTQLVSWYLERIEKRASLNAFLEVYREEALSQAALLDEKKQSGQPLGRLAGVVLGVKDNILHEGHKVSASSRILEGFTSVFTATALKMLLLLAA